MLSDALDRCLGTIPWLDRNSQTSADHRRGLLGDEF